MTLFDMLRWSVATGGLVILISHGNKTAFWWIFLGTLLVILSVVWTRPPE